ncbi:unnamed protein product [Amoebophrya sp. A120]|nr:unnamed protein product [Amoebophrya sp. A120]|eukprot:GSA120T00011847001.1
MGSDEEEDKKKKKKKDKKEKSNSSSEDANNKSSTDNEGADDKKKKKKKKSKDKSEDAVAKEGDHKADDAEDGAAADDATPAAAGEDQAGAAGEKEAAADAGEAEKNEAAGELQEGAAKEDGGPEEPPADGDAKAEGAEDGSKAGADQAGDDAAVAGADSAGKKEEGEAGTAEAKPADGGGNDAETNDDDKPCGEKPPGSDDEKKNAESSSGADEMKKDDTEGQTNPGDKDAEAAKIESEAPLNSTNVVAEETTKSDDEPIQRRDKFGNVLPDNVKEEDLEEKPSFSPRSPKPVAVERGSPRPMSPGRYSRDPEAGGVGYRSRVAAITGKDPDLEDPILGGSTTQDPEVAKFLEGVSAEINFTDKTVNVEPSSAFMGSGGGINSKSSGEPPMMDFLRNSNPAPAGALVPGFVPNYLAAAGAQPVITSARSNKFADVEVAMPHNLVPGQRYDQVEPRVYDHDYSPQKHAPEKAHWSQQFVNNLRKSDEDLLKPLPTGVAGAAAASSSAMHHAKSPTQLLLAPGAASGAEAPTKYVLNPAFLPLGDMIDSVIRQFKNWLRLNDQKLTRAEEKVVESIVKGLSMKLTQVEFEPISDKKAQLNHVSAVMGTVGGVPAGMGVGITAPTVAANGKKLLPPLGTNNGEIEKRKEELSQKIASREIIQCLRKPMKRMEPKIYERIRRGLTETFCYFARSILCKMKDVAVVRSRNLQCNGPTCMNTYSVLPATIFSLVRPEIEIFAAKILTSTMLFLLHCIPSDVNYDPYSPAKWISARQWVMFVRCFEVSAITGISHEDLCEKFGPRKEPIEFVDFMQMVSDIGRKTMELLHRKSFDELNIYHEEPKTCALYRFTEVFGFHDAKNSFRQFLRGREKIRTKSRTKGKSPATSEGPVPPGSQVPISVAKKKASPRDPNVFPPTLPPRPPAQDTRPKHAHKHLAQHRGRAYLAARGDQSNASSALDRDFDVSSIGTFVHPPQMPMHQPGAPAGMSPSMMHQRNMNMMQPAPTSQLQQPQVLVSGSSKKSNYSHNNLNFPQQHHSMLQQPSVVQQQQTSASPGAETTLPPIVSPQMQQLYSLQQEQIMNNLILQQRQIVALAQQQAASLSPKAANALSGGIVSLSNPLSAVQSKNSAVQLDLDPKATKEDASFLIPKPTASGVNIPSSGTTTAAPAGINATPSVVVSAGAGAPVSVVAENKAEEQVGPGTGAGVDDEAAYDPDDENYFVGEDGYWYYYDVNTGESVYVETSDVPARLRGEEGDAGDAGAKLAEEDTWAEQGETWAEPGEEAEWNPADGEWDENAAAEGEWPADENWEQSAAGAGEDDWGGEAEQAAAPAVQYDEEGGYYDAEGGYYDAAGNYYDPEGNMYAAGTY